MGKKNKKITVKSSEKVDVLLIMSDIKKRARNRELEEDIKKLSSINIKDIPLDNSDFDDTNSPWDEENICDNLSYINRNYSLTDKYNFVTTHRKGFFGKIVNKIISKLFLAIKIFIDRLVVSQESFNIKVVRLFNRFSKGLQEMADRQKGIEEDLQSVADRQKGAEEELKKDVEGKIEIAKKDLQYPSLNIDYKKFEDQFRGDQKEILGRQRQYLRFFHECKNVMDIGCGRGEFIELLHKNGAGAFGVETDSAMVDECKRKNLNVVNDDVVSYLEGQIGREQPDNIDGIFVAQ
ncbi:MAG: methionine biosynthesis protein MetW, partial [Candidatus Gracilibacteria bacterium]|nr:methionine biosynthesis protein MetW [Candidatus Gracilibacteria bacterium]